MPNLKPVCDSLKNLRLPQDSIERSACIGVNHYDAISQNQAGEQLAELEALALHLIAFKVHEAALHYGVKVTGATAHYVNEIP